MNLLKVFTVTCVIICFQEVCGNITEQKLTEFQRSEKNFMALKFIKGSCYNIQSLSCVLYSRLPDNKFGVQDILPMFNVFNFVSYNIKYGDDTTAYKLDKYEVDTREKTLNEVVDHCKNGGHLKEGYVRIINVVESAAFTIVYRFYELSNKLLDNDIDKLTEVSDIFFKWIAQVRVKFAKFNIWFEPFRQMVETFEVVIINDDKIKERKAFYREMYREFWYRFSSMCDLVNVDDDFKTSAEVSPEESLQKLKKTMKIAQELFTTYDVPITASTVYSEEKIIENQVDEQLTAGD